MKTIYEQIQNAVETIESRLFEKQTHDEVAGAVYMSSRGFYNYFWAITGFTYKEYVIKRRLSEAAKRLVSSNATILDIALDVAYESHESFSRAFKKEFGVTPSRVRETGLTGKEIERVKLYGEINMGIIVKVLPELPVTSFVAFHPNAEMKANDKMIRWLAEQGMDRFPHRVFGHNINREGELTTGEAYDGYKFMVWRENHGQASISPNLEVIRSGRFLVTGIEGSLESDPEGRWIMEGWRKMNQLIEEKAYQVKQPVRWFEEHLAASEPNLLRLDLYLEIN